MKLVQISEERKAQLLKRLAEIDNNAVNINGYYVLTEKEKTIVFCTGRLLEVLEHFLRARRGVFGMSSTCYQCYDGSKYSCKYIGVPTRNEYAYYLDVRTTAKKTTEHLKTFLENPEKFVTEYYDALERIYKNAK